MLRSFVLGVLTGAIVTTLGVTIAIALDPSIDWDGPLTTDPDQDWMTGDEAWEGTDVEAIYEEIHQRSVRAVD